MNVNILEILTSIKNIKINVTCLVFPFYTIRKFKIAYVAHTEIQQDSVVLENPARTVLSDPALEYNTVHSFLGVLSIKILFLSVAVQGFSTVITQP